MKDLKPKYFLYARKSTEDDDHQIMSIEAQLFELREYARKENLEILEEFQEPNDSTIDRIHRKVRKITRVLAGKQADETVGIIDSQVALLFTLVLQMAGIQVALSHGQKRNTRSK